MSDLRKIISKALRGPRPSPKHRWINTRIESAWDEARQKYVDTYAEGFWYDGPMALAMDTAPIWVAEDYRWVNDNGTHPVPSPVGGEATYAAAENTAITVDLNGDKQYRLRINFAETDGASGTGNEFTAAPILQYSINGGTWTTMGAATDVRYFSDGSSTDNETITAGEHVLSYSGNEPDVDGSLTHDNSPAAMGAIWSNDNAEFEYTVNFAGAGLGDGDTVTFRMLAPDGTTAVTFTNVPTANLSATNAASGSPSVTKPTSTGSATVIQTASGTPSITKPTSTGSAKLGYKTSGTPSVTKPTSTGSAQIVLPKTASGSPTVSKPTATGSAFKWPKVYLNTTQTLVGATEMTVTSVAADGTSITFSDPSGAPTGSLFLGVENRNNGDVGWIAVTVTASAADQTATGAPVVAKPTSSGAALVIISATGSPSITKPTSTGVAERILSASGAPQVTKPTSTGAAQRVVTSSGTAQITKPTSTGAAERQVTASGSPSVTKPTSTGTAERSITASGASSVTKPTSTGAAERVVTSSGSPSVTKPTSTGAAKLGYKASGTPSVSKPTSTGSANANVTADHNASGNPVITKPTSTGAATIIKTASGSPQVGKPTSTGVAEVVQTASGSPQVTKPTSTGAAIVIKTASGSPQITKPTSTGVAEVSQLASGSPQVSKPTATGNAKIGYKASGSPQVSKPTSTGNANADLTGPSVVFGSYGA